MKESVAIQKLERFFNLIELLGIVLVLLLAFVFQLLFHELPCPLCLLQRIGFFGIAFGFLLNLRFGLRPSHYALSLLSALFTSFVALRQVALHVLPGSGTYGSAIFGLHLYTWSFIISMIIILVTLLLMSIDRQYQFENRSQKRSPKLTHFLFLITTLLVAINLIAVVMQCGLKECPENPVSYELLSH